MKLLRWVKIRAALQERAHALFDAADVDRSGTVDFEACSRQFATSMLGAFHERCEEFCTWLFSDVWLGWGCLEFVCKESRKPQSGCRLGRGKS